MASIAAAAQIVESPISDEEARECVRKLIGWIGDDPTREGLAETPDRVIRAWRDMFQGYGKGPEEYGKVFNEEKYDDIVVLRGCEFFSFCEHHMLPFAGTVSIGYIADGKVLGLSKLARIADLYAKRLQVQERMTHEIAKAVETLISPRGVAVVAEGVHSCMTMRGVSKQRARMTTSAMLGAFREDATARAEIMALLRTRGEHE